MSSTLTTVAGRVTTASRRWKFGVPQAVAALMLLLFMGQGLWLASHTPVTQAEIMYVHPAHPAAGFRAENSPFTTLVVRAFPAPSPVSPPPWPSRLPFLAIGTLLGASLWYVARRLYGNAGGYVALTLYALSPTMITYSARTEPQIVAAWGVFGCVFTAIAVAHTLYAPREVFLWNRKRTVLLGTAIGLGMAAQFWTVLAVLLGLMFMFYLVPERCPAALGIMAAACAVGLGIFWAIHGFSAVALLADVRSAGLAEVAPRMLFSSAGWRMMATLFLRNGPGFTLLLLAAGATFAAWPHTRFFGTQAPLLTAFILIVFGLTWPAAAGFSSLIVALPFLCVFTAGVWSDLLESRRAPMALGVLSAALVAHAWFSLAGLWRIR